MKVGIYGITISEETYPYLQSLIHKLDRSGVEIVVYKPFLEDIYDRVSFEFQVETFDNDTDLKGKIDILISVGGDGTFLRTITFVRDSGIPILGVNLGRLGFLSSISRDKVEVAVDALVNGNYILDSRILIKLVTKNELFGDLNFALNEMCVYKKDPHSMLTISTYVDDQFLNSYWADGLIIATPTGSTAYSLSCGGPIIVPGSENFIITPIASHNLTVRPIVIPDESKVRVQVEGREKQFFVSLDSRFNMVDSTFELTLEKEDFKINLLRMENQNFYRTIREKLNWGLDIRNYPSENH